VLGYFQAQAMTTTQIAALDTQQIVALTNVPILAWSSTQIAALASDGIGLLPMRAIRVLTVDDFAAMSTDQIHTMTSQQLGELTTVQWQGFSDIDVADLTTRAVLGITSTAFNALTTSQLDLISSAQLHVLTTQVLHGLSTAIVASFGSDALGGLDTHQFASFSTAQIAALTTGVFASIGSADLAALNTVQIHALTTDQIAAIGTDMVAGLSTRDIAALDADQIAALATDTIQAMTGKQLDAMFLATPIVLDLSGHGIHTLSASQGVSFDMNGTGNKQQWGWITGGEGFLAMADSSGHITSGAQLFGTGTLLADGSHAANGFQALAAQDTNHDGIISAADANFSKLGVWVATDNHGVLGQGEFYTLAQLGITSLNLNASKSSQVDNGNLIGLISSYTTSDGATHEMADVWFAKDTAQAGSSTVAQTSTHVHNAALPSWHELLSNGVSTTAGSGTAHDAALHLAHAQRRPEDDWPPTLLI